MSQLYNSKIKTQHSAIDAVSVNDLLPPSDQNEKIDELAQLYVWTSSRTQNQSFAIPDRPKEKPCSYFMLKLDSLHHLAFRRTHKQTKVNLQLVARLINLTTGHFYPKCAKTIKILQQSNNQLYQLKQSICYYFYSPNEQELLARIELLVNEEEEIQNQLQPVFLQTPWQCLGTIDIECKQQTRSREKIIITSPNQINIFDQHNQNEQKGPYCYYYVVKSEAYRHLDRLIQENTICGSNDKIPGVLGGYLPANENTLSDFAIVPEARGVVLQFNTIEISPLLLKNAQKKSELYAKSMFRSASKISYSLKQLTLKASFHNSWKVVSSSQTVLKDKQGLLPTNQSLISAIHKNQSNPSIIKQIENNFKKTQPNKIYTTDKNLELGLVFPNEEDCVLILQVTANITTTLQFQKSKEKKIPNESAKHTLIIPVCFAILSAKGMALHRFQALKFYIGCGLNSQHDVCQMLEKQIYQLQIIQPLPEIRKAFKRSVARLPKDPDTLSAMQSVKTLSNLTHISSKNLLPQLGTIQFQMHTKQSQQLAISTLEHVSLVLDNISGMTASKLQLKDKIQAQKQRISKQSKKAVQLKKKMNIELPNLIHISQKQKECIRTVVYKPMRADRKIEIEELMKYVTHHLPNIKQLIKENSQESNVVTKNKKEGKKKQELVYYPLKFKDNLSNLPFEELKLAPLFYFLHSNYQFPQNHNYYLFEKTPIELIKTELAQPNYNNCFFFNFLHLLPTLYQSTLKFPSIFFLTTKFYNEPPIRSELLTINKDTGQIILYLQDQLNEQEKKAASKIMHLEINFDEHIENHQTNLIHFIEYLHNALLKIDIVDYTNGIHFGSIFAPLRNLVRKRRNQTVLLHQDYVYHKNYIRGKLAVEIRCIRKTKIKHPTVAPPTLPNFIEALTESKLEENIKKQPKQSETTDAQAKRIQQRIKKFKQAKLKPSTSRTKSPPKQPSHSPEQHQMEQKHKKVEQLWQNKFVTEQLTIKVTQLKKYYFFIQVENKQDKSHTYRLSFNDPDQPWLNRNPLAEGEEMIAVKDPTLLDKEDKQQLLTLKKSQQKMDRCLKLNQNGLLELDSKQRAQVLLCYLSTRKYREWNNHEPEEDLLTMYNRERIITCSLVEAHTANVQAIFSIQVVPIPDQTNIEIELYRPENQKILVHLPFVDPNFIEQNIDQVMIDDPYALLTSAQRDPTQFDKKSIPNSSRGLLLQLNTRVPPQQCKQVNLLIINNLPEKQKIGGQSRKAQRSRLKSRYELSERFSYGPPTLNVSLKIWGCHKLTATVDLWLQSDLLFKIEPSLFSHNMNSSYFYIFSENQQLLKIRKNLKIPSDQPELFKIPSDYSPINGYSTICSGKVGQQFVNLHVVEAISVLEQQEALSNRMFKEVQPVLRMVLSLETRPPNFKETLRVNIDPSSSQKIMEEPFSYSSSASMKSQFKILTSNPNLLWTKGSDSAFQLQSKAQKKITLLFHIQNIVSSQISPGICQSIILGIKWDKGIDYFCFKFNLI